MGIVVRQSFWTSVITYGGVVLGYISMLVLFPKFLTTEQIGLIRLIQANGALLMPIVMIGLPSVWIQNFPKLKSHINQKKTLSALLFLILVANLVICLLVFLLEKPISNWFAEKSAAYLPYIWVSLVIMVSQSSFELFMSFFRTFYSIKFPNYLREIHLRFINILIILFFAVDLINFHQVIIGISLNYIITTFILWLVMGLKHKNWLTLDIWYTLQSNWRYYIYYGGYFAILAIGAAFNYNISTLLISSFLGLKQNGIFTICLFIGMVIEMPRRGLSQIVVPLVSKSFSEAHYSELEMIYKRSSLNLFLIGALLLIGILTNIQDLFDIIPQGETFRSGFGVVLIMGLNKIISLGLGVTNEILAFSPFKKINLYITGLNIVLTLITGLILIPIWGIEGAALSMMISQMVAQLLRLQIIHKRLKIHPFTPDHIKVIIIMLAIGCIVFFTYFGSHPITNIALRSIITSILFIGIAYFWKVSIEMNQLINRILKI